MFSVFVLIGYGFRNADFVVLCERKCMDQINNSLHFHFLSLFFNETNNSRRNKQSMSVQINADISVLI